MSRLTKTDIERKLLSGFSISWKDVNNKSQQVVLHDSKQRRLFRFLLTTKVREPTGLPPAFIAGLAAAYQDTLDPASAATGTQTIPPSFSTWRLRSIETEGFGGLNSWGGTQFRYDFDGESLLIDGPNGSGKSSLVGALLWALSGERPRDHADDDAHEPQPVFSASGEPLGDWPPIASYPFSAPDLKTPVYVRVELEFQNAAGVVAKIQRSFDGNAVTENIDPAFEIPSILLDTGLLMPARLAALRINEGGGLLTDAIQKLTGLDDLSAIATLVDGLCNKGREYLSHNKKELAVARKEFEQALIDARSALVVVHVSVPDFTPSDTTDSKGNMATFGQTLTEQEGALTSVVSNDLAQGLVLSDASIQHRIISAIGAAEADLLAGIEGLPTWKSLRLISESLNPSEVTTLRSAIESSKSALENAIQFLAASTSDSKFQLKVLAAQWHERHKSGPIRECPLCEQTISGTLTLSQELEKLRSAGDAAARSFEDNRNAIVAGLTKAIPSPLRKFGEEALALQPRAALLNDIEARFLSNERYAGFLLKFVTFLRAALPSCPTAELSTKQTSPDVALAHDVSTALAIAERLVALAEWYRAHATAWTDWWKTLTRQQDDAAKHATTTTPASSENLTTHLTRLSDAIAKAEPYRKGAAAMRAAWVAGRNVVSIERETKLRESIAESLVPLKALRLFAEAAARESINQLSSRIDSILEKIHLTEQFQFREAKYNRKDGLLVRGGFVSDLQIDATLVASTSWLRAVLWAFLFALREEAIEQIGHNPFPILIFDDPQSTFDSEHRHRWAQYIASLQHGVSKEQVILTTYDETFVDLIQIAGVQGRRAMIVASGPELGHVGIFEGSSLDRKWSEAKSINTPNAGRDYIEKIRVYVEGLLRLMLRGQTAGGTSVLSGLVVGQCRNKLEQLRAKGIEPWNHSEFSRLIAALSQNATPIKYMEMSHHAGRIHLGMAEAIDVEAHWRTKIRPALERGFRLAREHYLLHGGLAALHTSTPSAILPEGYRSQVRKFPLKVVGRAAALTDGRIADGCLDFQEYSPNAHKSVTLGRHFAYRVTTPTLEPVARPGDVLLVREAGEPSPKSLVVALYEDRLLARRYELAENHSDIAVLTAQAVNPRRIAPPVIAHKATFILHKVIGVLYDPIGWTPPELTASEVCECGGEAVLTALSTGTFGLVEVIGSSAEPLVLDKQFLLIRKEIVGPAPLTALNGKPVVAADSDNQYYFKRLRLIGDKVVVLESLDSAGDYDPVALSLPGGGRVTLERIWPVAGVLFELPD